MTNEESEVQDVGKRIELTLEKLGVKLTSAFVPLSKSRNANDKNHLTLNWKVTLWREAPTGARPILETDYSAGSAHCPGYKWSDHSLYQQQLLLFECEHGLPGYVTDSGRVMRKSSTPILPKTADVVASLMIDAGVIDFSTFEEWASDYGFDPDSRKAEKTYRACLETALKLRTGLGDEGLKALREACEGY